MEFDKALSESVDNIMNFAEILYKCTLCTTLPSILTSKTSFVSHVKGQHFNRNHTRCPECSLTFETEEDLHAHSRSSHCVELTSKKEENSDSKVIREEEITSVEDSLSSPTQELELEKGENNVGMNYNRCSQYNATCKPDITSIEVNCSADKQLPLKLDSQGVSEVMEHPWPENRPTVNIEYGLENSIRQHSCVNNLTKIHAVADQILAVNSTRAKPVGSNMIISPGYTPEFGKFTKLVREGGNIVYFCQVCNWKSQIKSHFQIHCQGKAHIEKLKCAEHDEKSPSPTPRREQFTKEIQCDSKRESPMNLSTDIGNSSSKTGSPLRLASGRNKLEHQNKRKRSVTISLRNQSSDRDGWQSSDSDSDSSDLNRTRPFHSGRTPVKKRYSKENKTSPDSEMNSKVDNSCKPVLHGNSDSDSNHLHISHTPMKHYSSMSLPSKDYSEEIPAKFPFGLYSQIHNQILWNLSNKPSEKGRNTPDSQHSALDSFTYSDRNSSLSTQVSSLRGSPIYPDVVKSDSDYMYRCSLCSFGCNRIQEYRAHFEFQHEHGNSVNEQGPLYGNEGKELWKVNKIKEYLSELICPFPKGNVSRDLLLQKISSSAQLPEAIHWGPACNRAVREIFPDTLAQRKGKFKKTYFFGVSFIEQVQEPADDLSDPELMQYQPLRDMSQDLEKILEHLHNLVEFSDDLECSISRDDLLTILHKRIDEPDVLYWGMQCNRAIRIVFPSVIIKRKGKFKTTVYQGVDFKEDVRSELQQLPLSMPSKRGRPRKISTEDSSELYQMGMNWTDAIRTGHSETYKMFTNIHIPRPMNSDHLPVTRGWGPSLAYHDTDDPQKQTRTPNSTFLPQDSGNLNSHSESELKDKKSRETSPFNNLLMKDVNMQIFNGVKSKSVLHCNIKDSYTERVQAYASENEAKSVSDMLKHKHTPNQNEDDQSDDDQNENTDEDADDEESIGPSIEDKDID